MIGKYEIHIFYSLWNKHFKQMKDHHSNILNFLYHSHFVCKLGLEYQKISQA